MVLRSREYQIVTEEDNITIIRDNISTDKMVLAKSKNAVGLGNSLMNDRFGRGKGADRKKVSAGIHRTGVGGETVRELIPTEVTSKC